MNIQKICRIFLQCNGEAIIRIILLVYIFTYFAFIFLFFSFPSCFGFNGCVAFHLVCSCKTVKPRWTHWVGNQQHLARSGLVGLVKPNDPSLCWTCLQFPGLLRGTHSSHNHLALRKKRNLVVYRERGDDWRWCETKLGSKLKKTDKT